MGELETVVEKLRTLGSKPKQSRGGWVARCPAHPDQRPSLSVGQSADGSKVLLKCHTGCMFEDILEALDLEASDLFEEGPARKGREFVESYNYTDEEGELLFQVQRFLEPDGRKTFVQRRPGGDGTWLYTTTNIRKPLYHLPQILKAKEQGKTIWVVEGEKDVQNLEARGVPATCNAGGAGKWLREHTETLAGTDVVICADRDYPGWKHAKHVQDDLIPVANSVTVVQPPDPHKDISDYLETVTGRFYPQDFVEKNSFDVEEIIEETDPYRETLKELSDIAAKNIRVEQKVARAKAALDHLLVEGEEGVPSGRLVRWADFLKEPVEEYDWVIPNLLERQERVMVVAAEGVGKTMLARQVAIMASGGMHPFSRDAMPRIRTLTFDLENPERIIRRTSKKIMERLRYFRDGDIPAHLVVKPDGFDLLKPIDRTIVESYVQAIEPDLILLGPIYKTFIDPGGRTAESVATEIARFFDYIRDTYNCAWWLEHHAPLGTSIASRDLRPFGSAVWSRWSEFGISLQPDPTRPDHYQVKHYRGMRDERRWPKTMKRGDTFPFEVVEWL